MDQDDFIKIQHQSPVKATHNFASYYMNHFYNDDSASDMNIIKKQNMQYSFSTNSEEILNKIQQNIDIRTSNIQEIIHYARENFPLGQSFDWSEFEKNLKKRKLSLKRDHAKNRESQEKKNQYYVICDNSEAVDFKSQLQAQIKKKRNRMSAQISRDRKKIKIQQLEANNKILKAQTQKMLQQNQKLKRQLQEFNRVQEKKIQACKGKNRFLSLLIMLGMLFLFTLIRETVKGSQSSEKVGNKINKSQGSAFGVEQQSKIIQEGQKTFRDLASSSQFLFGNQKTLQNVLDKLEELKSSSEQIKISKALKQELEIAKKQFC